MPAESTSRGGGSHTDSPEKRGITKYPPYLEFSGYEDLWQDVYRRVADDLSTKIMRRYYEGLVEETRKQPTPAEKLVYLYLALFQPQTFATLRKGLDMYETSLARALKSLKERGAIVRGDDYFWWIRIEKISYEIM